MSDSKTTLDWSRPIQFSTGEPLELMETTDSGRRVFRPNASRIEVSIWDVAENGRATIGSIAERFNMHVVNRDE